MDFTADITRVVFVHHGLESHHVVAATAELARVHGIVDGDIADAFLGERLAYQLSRVGVVAPQTAQVFRQHDIELALLNFRQHTLKAGAVLIHAGIAVVAENPRHVPALFLAVPAQKLLLILNACAGSLVGVVFLELAHTVLFVMAILHFRRVRRDLD